MVKSGLAERSLLEKTEQTKLRIFTVVNYSLPESTASMATQLPIEPAVQLLENCESYRQGIWDLLVKEIKKAIKDRTERMTILNLINLSLIIDRISIY